MDSIVQDKLASLLDEKKSLTAQLLRMPEWEERKAYRGAYLASEEYVNFKVADALVKGKPEYIRRQEIISELRALRQMDEE
jgi:hypothetical protein